MELITYTSCPSYFSLDIGLTKRFRQIVVTNRFLTVRPALEMNSGTYATDPRLRCIQDLPDDVLGVIFDNLPLIDKLRFTQVCRRWHQLGRSPYFWQHVDLSGCDVGVTGIIPVLFSTCMTRLGHLNLYDCKDVHDELLVCIGKNAGKSLTEIELGRCTKVTDTGITSLVQNAPYLRMLGLRRCRRISDVAVSAIGKHCVELRELSLKKCERVSDMGVAELVHCKKLEVLQLGHLSNLTDVSISQLCKLTSLKMLSLRGCKLVHDIAIQKLTEGCRNLERIDLADCNEIGNDSLLAIAANCPQSRMFMLNNCNCLTDSGIVALIKNCPLMEKLFCTGCRDISDGSLIHFAAPEASSGMLTLFLQDCDRITDESLAPALQRMTSLRTLCLRGCVLVTGRSIRALNAASYLCTLDLGSCNLIQNDDLEAVIPNLVNIRYLSLGGLSDLRDSGVICVSRSCRKLVWLSLKLCNRISDESLQALAVNCTHLGSLGLHGCGRGITASGLKSLVNSLSALYRLNIGPEVRLTTDDLRFFRTACSDSRLSMTIGHRNINSFTDPDSGDAILSRQNSDHS